MADFKEAQHVKANFGDGKEVIAHVYGPAHENSAGETKYEIQAPDGTTDDLGYREPQDRDERGSGGTFWSIP